jgi:hypothetical protein
MKRAYLFPFLGTAMLIIAGLSAPAAQARYIVTLTQRGSDVVETGNGSLDLTALTFLFTNSPPPPGGEEARINASVGLVVLGPTSPTPIAVYTGLTGPSSFGSGSFNDANSGSGSLVGVAGSLAPFTILGVPVGYVSGSSLRTSTDTWDDATFASLGVTPGVYTWTWGSGRDADSFRLIVAGAPLAQLASVDLPSVPSVPEPATWALMGVGFAGLGFARYRATRKSAALPG